MSQELAPSLPPWAQEWPASRRKWGSLRKRSTNARSSSALEKRLPQSAGPHRFPPRPPRGGPCPRHRRSHLALPAKAGRIPGNEIPLLPRSRLTFWCKPACIPRRWYRYLFSKPYEGKVQWNRGSDRHCMATGFCLSIPRQICSYQRFSTPRVSPKKVAYGAIQRRAKAACRGCLSGIVQMPS